MSDAPEHVLTRIEERHGSWVRPFRVRCSCGYTTGWRGYPGPAEQSARDHRAAVSS